ncbi:MAG: type II toxin-antitoxin system YafQ family toxin [Prevotella sp.]|nr:type II toxin-antitoxin system YafQ family toxin [Prevotella sp.]
MKKLQPTTQYKKDYKRIRNNAQKVEDLKEILKKLMNEEPIPAEYLPHKLTGNYKGCMECHIQNDFLLIWIDEENDIIELVRLGSHSELFGKG